MFRKSHLLALALNDRGRGCRGPDRSGELGSQGRPAGGVGYLIGKGYTPSQVQAWTVGACSHEVKPAACFGPSKGANLTSRPDGHVTIPAWLARIQYPGTSSKPTVYLAGSITIPARLARTQYPGTSSRTHRHRDRHVGRARDRAGPLPGRSHLLDGGGVLPAGQGRLVLCDVPAGAASAQVGRSIGFQWGDAGIGAGFAFGIVLLLGGAIAGLLISRQNRRRQVAHA
jgi:hypothetical protein